MTTALVLLALLAGAAGAPQQPDSVEARTVGGALAPVADRPAAVRDTGNAAGREAGVKRPGVTRASRYIFLHPEQDYGSAAIRSPADVWLNRGLSVLVFFPNDQRSLGRIRWESGWASVRDAVTHPRKAIRRAGGVENWLHVQLLPNRGRVWEWAWAPNYSGHIVAGGITFRFVREWYEERGVPAPWLAAFLTNALTSTTNEIIEGQKGPPGDASTVADLLIFDQLAVAIFSFDFPSRFFAERLQAADWSPQASISLPDARVLNSSQILSYKLPVPFVERLGVLFLIGQSAGTGLRLRVDGGFHVSGTVGFETTTRIVDPATGLESVQVDWGGGAYVDRDNSLLVSAVISPRMDARFQLNVYPGVLPGPLRPTGVWAARSRRAQWSMGLAFRRTLGVGMGVDFGS